MTYCISLNINEVDFFFHSLSFYKSFVMYMCKSFAYYSPRIFFFLTNMICLSISG